MAKGCLLYTSLASFLHRTPEADGCKGNFGMSEKYGR